MLYLSVMANYAKFASLFFSLCRYKGAMIEDVPRIFEAVFQCTLEVSELCGKFVCSVCLYIEEY